MLIVIVYIEFDLFSRIELIFPFGSKLKRLNNMEFIQNEILK